jgi:hypothetical protein
VRSVSRLYNVDQLQLEDDSVGSSVESCDGSLIKRELVMGESPACTEVSTEGDIR